MFNRKLKMNGHKIKKNMAEDTKMNILFDLIQFDEETASGMMVKECNKVLPSQKARSILISVRNENNHEFYPYFYVVNGNNKLLGFFKLRDLLNVSPDTLAINLVRKSTPKVSVDDPCDEVASLMTREHLSSIPVVDKNNVIQGIITFDSVFKVIEDVASEEIFSMVGTTKQDLSSKDFSKKVRSRIPWLFTTFAGGIVSAIILRHFKFTLSEYSIIIFFVPFVLGLAGNIGIQGATVIVRGLATGDIKPHNLRSTIIKEISVGCFNGVIFGLVSGVFIYILSGLLLNTIPLLGLIISLGVVLAVTGATLIGSFSPLIFVKFNIDPAISVGPFITVTNDVIGLAIYLSVTTSVISICH